MGSHTYNVKLSRHLLWAKTVGDLARVAAAVFLPQVADGQPRQTPCPAGIWGQRATIFQPAHGGAGVTSRYARELDTLACIHLPRLETVQDGRWGLVGVWRSETEVFFYCSDKDKYHTNMGKLTTASCSPITESLAPLLWRVSPLYLCLVMHRYVERASSFWTSEM